MTKHPTFLLKSVGVVYPSVASIPLYWPDYEGRYNPW